MSTYKSVFLIVFCLCLPAKSQEKDLPPTNDVTQKLTLIQAEMCEGIRDYSPINPAIGFSIEIGQVSCFISFDPVPKEMYIFQKWYHRDKLSTTQKLLLKPPRWSTFGSIQLREADKGPWRVEITDQSGKVLNILRFSIID